MTFEKLVGSATSLFLFLIASVNTQAGASMFSHANGASLGVNESISDVASPPAVPTFQYQRGFSIKPLEEMRLSEDQKATLRSEMEAQKIKGYVPSSDDKVVPVSAGIKNATPEMSRYRATVDPTKLAIKPASVARTSLAGAVLLGQHPEGVYNDGRWSGLSRIYRTADLGDISLDENDYVVSNGGIVMAKESINASVNGRPATFLLRKAPSGASSAVLRWVTDSKIYTLRADSPNARDSLIAIAEHIDD